MKIFNIIFVVLYIFLIFVLSLKFIRYWWPLLQPVPITDCNIQTFSEFQPKAGDILLSKWGETPEPFGKVPWWHHIAIVFEDKEGVLQIADFRTNTQNHIYGPNIHVVPLDQKIAHSKPTTMLALRRLSPPLDREQKIELLDAILSHKDIEFDKLYILTHFIHITGLSEYLPETKTMGCSPFVFSVLNKIGVMHVDIYKFPLYRFYQDYPQLDGIMLSPYQYESEIYINKRDSKERIE